MVVEEAEDYIPPPINHFAHIVGKIVPPQGQQYTHRRR